MSKSEPGGIFREHSGRILSADSAITRRRLTALIRKAGRCHDLDLLLEDIDRSLQDAPESVKEDRFHREASVYLTMVRRALEAGDACAAAVRALHLGSWIERLGVRPYEPHVVRGRKALVAARAGHAKVFGTAEARDAERQAIRGHWDRVRAAHPKYKVARIDADVAKTFVCSVATVRRARRR